MIDMFFFFFSSRRRHTRWPRDWSSDVCSSDLMTQRLVEEMKENARREAAVIIRESESQAERIIEASRQAEGNLQSEIQSLKRLRRQLAESLRATVEMYQRLLEQDLKANAEDAEPPKA